jgi:ribosomal protein L37AE/L43A
MSSHTAQRVKHVRAICPQCHQRYMVRKSIERMTCRECNTSFATNPVGDGPWFARLARIVFG